MKRQPTDEWWATVIHAFQAHVREESEFLESYERLVRQVSDRGTRFLIELILEDERRHHDLMTRLATSARGEADAWSGTPGPPSPHRDEAGAMLEPTERFLDAEREDRAQLRRLARQLEAVNHDSLWPLLVELMEIDTQKHIRILEYIRDRLRRSANVRH